MASFERALSIVLGHEGNDTITDDPLDPGGLTRWGISQAAHPTVDIRNLTRELAADIYRSNYWTPLQCDEMPPPIALCVFDCGVNQGVKTAAKLLQAAVGTTQDGIIGGRTLSACWRKPSEQVIRRFMTERAHKYIGLGGFATYGRGWIARVIDVAITAAEWDSESG